MLKTLNELIVKYENKIKSCNETIEVIEKALDDKETASDLEDLEEERVTAYMIRNLFHNFLMDLKGV